MSKPYDHNKFLGYVFEITPTSIRVQIPSSILLQSFYYNGEVLSAGLVGAFAVIEGNRYGFLARFTSIGLPQTEKNEITEKNIDNKDSEFHPQANLELLGVFDNFNPFELKKTASLYPRIGAKVYACSNDQISTYIARFGLKQYNKDSVFLPIGTLLTNNTTCHISIDSLFGRHCAVVGTTGGGKSWTVAHLIEEVVTRTKSKCILIDPTGEYKGIAAKMKDIEMGDEKYFFSYKSLSIDELMFLLKPAARTQAPKLMDAIRSLKMEQLIEKKYYLLKSLPEDSPIKQKKFSFYESLFNTYVDKSHHTLIKCKKEKKILDELHAHFVHEVDDNICDFHFLYLGKQITNECVYPSDRYNLGSWGDVSEVDLSNCTSLITRIDNLNSTTDFDRIFNFSERSTIENGGESIGRIDLKDEIDNFLTDEEYQILRIDFSNVSYDYQVREILVDALGKLLLHRSRKGEFKTSPLIVFLDEAHQFLNKTISDEYFAAKPLDAFEQISKESRKYGLFLCISTQMPRDIPLGTFSQIGTFIVHRLINEQDKKSVENAASSANKNILSFLPILGEGEAVLVGVDFPMPLLVKINPPTLHPQSGTPKIMKKEESIVEAKDSNQD